MDGGFWWALLGIAGVLLLFIIETMAYWGVGGWLDVRGAQDADDVRRNIEEYGPEAPGLKLHLLPEDERAEVLAAREAARAASAARRHGRPVRH